MVQLTLRHPPPATYALAGLQITSEIALPNTLLCRDFCPDDNKIIIRRSKVPESLVSATTFQNAQYDGRDILISIPEVARYMIYDRREILVDADPRAANGDITAFLLGTVFGALCHLRGIVPMHASAIDVRGGCALFAGYSGAGKSTLSAALCARGYQVISDDVCFLREDNKGNMLVWPGIGRIRLWADAVDQLGYKQSKIERELRGFNKYQIPISPPQDPFVPRRLLCLYQLVAAQADEAPRAIQIIGAKSIELLVPNVYRLTLAEYIGAKPHIFSLCASIARQVQIFEFRRQMSFAALPAALDFLEQHLQDAR